MKKSITYFEKEGKENTDELIQLVKDRLKENDIKYVVIASVSGECALKLADEVSDVTIINVTHHAGFKNPNELEITSEMIETLEEKGIKTLIASHALSGTGRGVTNKFGGINPTDLIAQTLRMFSHGIKVCCEIAIMAADAGLIPVGEEVLTIGGRTQGVDSAAVLTAANMTGVFDIKFHEILAMPRP